MRLQTHLVEMSEKRSRQLNDTHLARKRNLTMKIRSVNHVFNDSLTSIPEFMIAEQKRLKINKELNDAEKRKQTVEREIRNFNTRFDILSGKLFEKKQNREWEEEQCREIHARMTERLREKEMSVFSLRNEIQSLNKEIEELKELLVSRHREALCWETKWKLTAEAKRQRDEELDKSGDIGIMKSEIHRMEVRLSQLSRAQEKLVHDMENCVHHRDHIFDGSTVRGKLSEVKPSKMVNTLQYKVNELKAKLKEAVGQVSAVEKLIEVKSAEKDMVEGELNKITEAVEDERLQLILLQDEIDQATMLKQEVNERFRISRTTFEDFVPSRILSTSSICSRGRNATEPWRRRLSCRKSGANVTLTGRWRARPKSKASWRLFWRAFPPNSPTRS